MAVKRRKVVFAARLSPMQRRLPVEKGWSQGSRSSRPAERKRSGLNSSGWLQCLLVRCSE